MFGAAAVRHKIICIFFIGLKMLKRGNICRNTVLVFLVNDLQTFTQCFYQLTGCSINNYIFGNFIKLFFLKLV